MGLKVVGREVEVDSSWEEIEAIGRSAVIWTVVPALPLAPDLVVMAIDPVVEAIPALKEEGIIELVETEGTVLCKVARVVLIAVISTGAEGDVAPQGGYGHQLKDEVV
jgi:hypothetical protein